MNTINRTIREKETMKYTSKILIATALFMRGCTVPCPAQEVNMQVIATIESSNGHDMSVYNILRYAVGKYQVSAPVVDLYNKYHGTHFVMWSLLSDRNCLLIANWYINEYIPDRLWDYGLADTLQNRLLSYNSGINALRHGHVSMAYVKKYEKLEKISKNTNLRS